MPNTRVLIDTLLLKDPRKIEILIEAVISAKFPCCVPSLIDNLYCPGLKRNVIEIIFLAKFGSWIEV